MEISFDPDKNERNIRDRALSFESVIDFDFDSALIHTDTRRNYGEQRFIALGKLKDRIHVLCFTETPLGIRVISFRKANAREVKLYADTQTND